MDTGEFARTCQAGEVLAVAPVGLDVIAGSPRNQRGRYHPPGPASYTNTSARPRLVSLRTAFNKDTRSPPTVPKRPTTPSCSASVMSIDSLCTSIPTKTLLDCFMVRLRSKVDTQVPTLWLCVLAHVIHVTAETGLPSLAESHSVYAF